VVWVYRKTQWVALMSTDLDLTVEQIIEYYSARWKIEIDQSCCLHKSVFHGLASVMRACFGQVRGAVRNALSRSNSAAFA